MSTFTEIISKNAAPKNITKRINGVPVEIKSFVDVETFKNIVNTVVTPCFGEEGYRAENREITSRYAVLKYLTDIDVEEESVVEIFAQTQNGSWFGDIMREIVKLPLWGEIDLAIDRQIDYMIATRTTAFDKLCNDLSAIIATDFAASLADIKEVLEKLGNVDADKFVKAVTKKVVKETPSKTKSKATAKQKDGGANDEKPEGANN